MASADSLFRCRGIWALIAVVAIAGCTGLGDGATPSPEPSASVMPSASASANPVPSAMSPTPGTVDPWGPGEVALTWQWYRDAAKIAGATGRTYRLAASDLGHTVRLQVRGSAANFRAESRSSEPTGKVAAGVLDPTPVPLYSGTAKVGHTLTALPREWGPGEVGLAYQWYRSGADGDKKIDGATKVTYKLVPADAGHRLRVRVSGSKPGFATVRTYSGWTSEIDPADLVPGTPTVDGPAVSGKILTAHAGEWRPDGVTFAYRWYRSGLLIAKATGATLTLSGADLGYTITVKVTGKLAGYRELTVESAPTAKVVSRER